MNEYAERLHELYMQVHEKAAVRPFTLPPAYFAALEATAGDRLLCTVVHHEGRIVGFIITLKDGDTGYGYHIGFDREAGDTLPLYLRLLHASIADALALGAGNYLSAVPRSNPRLASAHCRSLSRSGCGTGNRS